MSLLKPAENTMAYLKMGIFGDTGSGKTWTASNVAIGLHKLIESKRPIAFFDTETGSNFMISKFKEAGVELLSFHGTALKDLTQIFGEVEKEQLPILIIDSITNVWDEFTESIIHTQLTLSKPLQQLQQGILPSYGNSSSFSQRKSENLSNDFGPFANRAEENLGLMGIAKLTGHNC